MEKIRLKGTFETPSVVLDSEEGKLEFSGRSLPEDTTTFYRPILNWIEEYLVSPKNETSIAIKLEYFNTATSKVLLNMLTKFEKTNGQVTVHWFHYEEDEDMLESGKEFEELVNLRFSYHTFE
jgi:hypothetical protein